MVSSNGALILSLRCGGLFSNRCRLRTRSLSLLTYTFMHSPASIVILDPKSCARSRKLKRHIPTAFSKADTHLPSLPQSRTYTQSSSQNSGHDGALELLVSSWSKHIAEKKEPFLSDCGFRRHRATINHDGKQSRNTAEGYYEGPSSSYSISR